MSLYANEKADGDYRLITHHSQDLARLLSKVSLSIEKSKNNLEIKLVGALKDSFVGLVRILQKAIS